MQVKCLKVCKFIPMEFQLAPQVVDSVKKLKVKPIEKIYPKNKEEGDEGN